ncbi:MAG: hypothetical protein MUQ56_10965, partial [Thermoleophilia bacterium]|nr:hypothetical protein [Thermoleophilia bacterium]
LDVVMPGMDGWEVLAHMKEDGTLRDIPAIMVSAQDPADEPPKCQMFCATIGDGLTLDQVIACTLGFSRAVMGTPSP